MVPRWRILRKPQKRGAVREDDVRHRVAEAAISQGDLDYELKEAATRIAFAEKNTFAIVFNEPRDSGEWPTIGVIISSTMVTWTLRRSSETLWASTTGKASTLRA